jgi:predicted SAM-dependent methyltransferase
MNSESITSPNGITRLHIGISTPAALPDAALDVFFDSTWTNLGDPHLPQASGTAPKPLSAYQKLRKACKRLLRNRSPSYDRRCEAAELRSKRMEALARSPLFQPFYWDCDSKLDFPDDALSFVFSEHFFEHLWANEAYALFCECYRILAPNGVLRISVPDADLRTYEPREPIAFDAGTDKTSTRGWLHPDVHKTRWNIYSLDLLLRLSGFRVRPIVYCNKDGKYVHAWPQRDDPEYPKGADWSVICSRAYILRTERSLIVDAIKDRPNV